MVVRIVALAFRTGAAANVRNTIVVVVAVIVVVAANHTRLEGVNKVQIRESTRATRQTNRSTSRAQHNRVTRRGATCLNLSMPRVLNIVIYEDIISWELEIKRANAILLAVFLRSCVSSIVDLYWKCDLFASARNNALCSDIQREICHTPFTFWIGDNTFWYRTKCTSWMHSLYWQSDYFKSVYCIALHSNRSDISLIGHSTWAYYSWVRYASFAWEHRPTVQRTSEQQNPHQFTNATTCRRCLLVDGLTTSQLTTPTWSARLIDDRVVTKTTHIIRGKTLCISTMWQRSVSVCVQHVNARSSITARELARTHILAKRLYNI